MKDLHQRYLHAKKRKAQRDWIAARLETLFEFGTKVIWGEGGFKKHSFTHLFAELFFIDCPVCLFWRGMFMGAVVSGMLNTVAILLNSLF